MVCVEKGVPTSASMNPRPSMSRLSSSAWIKSFALR